AAQDPVDLAVARIPAEAVLVLHGGQNRNGGGGVTREPPLMTPAVPPSGGIDAAGFHFFHHGVPLAAGRAPAVPAPGLVTALLADMDPTGFGHAFLPPFPGPLFGGPYGLARLLLLEHQLVVFYGDQDDVALLEPLLQHVLRQRVLDHAGDGD